MTPKEKAEELIYTFAQIIPPSSYVAFEEGVQINFDLENAKQCALVAVGEIIDLNLGLSNCDENNWDVEKFYQEVKQEIENL